MVPTVLGLSVQSTLLPRLNELRELFALSGQELRELVRKYPGVLVLSIPANVAPSASALQSLLGLSNAELRALVLKYPQALSLSPSNNLAPTLEALRTLLGLHRDAADGSLHAEADGDGDGTGDDAVAEAHLRAIVLAFPSVLGLSVEANLRPKLTFLADALQCTPSELRGHIARCPAMLGTSLERSLRPNVEAWREALQGAGHAEADFRAMVSKSGLRVLAASYEKRTRPRLSSAAIARVSPAAVLTKMRLTDAAFEVWLAGQQQQQQ